MEKEDRKHDVYGPENLIRYHTALSFVDRLVSEGFLRPADRVDIYTMIARKYGIELGSIFATCGLLSGPFRVIYTVPIL